jgi:MYXO-CTERM domain-containing protein
MSPLKLIALCLLMSGSAFGAISLVNGDFSTNNLNGWTVTGTASGASGAAAISSGGQILQDFSATAPDGLADWEASFQVSFGAVNDAHRIRLEGDAGADMITMRISGTSVQAFNAGTWANVVTGATFTANTPYIFTVSGTNFGTASRAYSVSLTDTSLAAVGTSTGNVSFFHATPNTQLFETFTFGASTGGIIVDNVSVVPEPASALLGGLGLLALLRRRR